MASSEAQLERSLGEIIYVNSNYCIYSLVSYICCALENRPIVSFQGVLQLVTMSQQMQEHLNELHYAKAIVASLEVTQHESSTKIAALKGELSSMMEQLRDVEGIVSHL